MPAVGTRPTVGFIPTQPFSDAGQIIEPSVSVPTANETRPAAIAAPEPDDLVEQSSLQCLVNPLPRYCL